MNKKTIENISATLKKMNEMAINHINDKNYEEALYIYSEILKFNKSLGLNIEVARTMINIGNILLFLNEITEAINYINEAEKIFEKNKSTKDLIYLNLLKSHIYYNQDLIQEATKEAQKALSLSKTNSFKGESYLALFNIYFKQNNNKSRSAIDNSIRYFELDNNNNGLCRALSRRVEYFKKLGQDYYMTMDKNRLEGIMNEGN